MRTSNFAGESVGDFEARLGAHITPTADGHWIYDGREPITFVRHDVAATFDDELEDDVVLYAACGEPRCVKPAHMENAR